ncbi:MAG: hypothetical protein QM769_03280 [Pseudoxanthomonas sp.]
MRIPGSSLIRLGYLGAPLLVLLLGCSSQISGSGAGEDAGVEDAGTVYVPPDMTYNVDAFWAADPPPMYCPLGGGTGMPPTPPGGTPECPDDKNRQGCPCPTEGEQKSCWPGLRQNRGLGICQDGLTTCVRNGEFGYVWGPCQGYTLPVPGETTGSAACKCFSAGRWAIDNVVPCFYTYNGEQIGATSSVMVAGKPDCQDMSKPLKAPTQPWSANSIKVDCAGHWKLCYTLKAGDAKNPQPTDCVVATVCSEGDYDKANQTSPLPTLPAWATTTPAQVACAITFQKSGGYGEMTVDGKSITCDQVGKVFNRINYCPSSCQVDPSTPECKSCVSDGSGNF